MHAVCRVGIVAPLILAGASAMADEIFQSVNADLDPAPFFWGAPSGTIGWYWTPASDVTLAGVQTKLTSGFNNINNNFTFTTTLYTDRPAAGGSALGSFDWHGTTFVDGPWLGGSFASALDLIGGTTYFVGFSGFEQAIGSLGSNSGAGVNWIEDPAATGAQNLGAGSGYTGVGFDAQMNTGTDAANIDSPILRFIQVPTPGTLAIGSVALFACRRRREQLG